MPAITPLPENVPARGQLPEVFIPNMDAFLAALPTLAEEINAAVDAMNLNDTTSTSTTSVVIGTGAKSITVQASKSYVPGMTVKIARTSDGTKWMVGDVTSYDSGTGALSLTVSKVQGSGTFTDWTISLAATEQIDDQFINSMTAVTPTLLDSAAIAEESDSGNRKKALLSAIATLFNISSVDRQVPVRQTVLSGPVDSGGLPSFGGSTGSATVTMSGTLEITAANGTANRTGSGTNLSWAGLSTNGTMYLYVDVGLDGTLTTGAGTLEPSYRWGGADITTSGQFTFNIQEMQGKVGNGSAAVQTHRVYVGEVMVAGGVVTAITWYALMGRYVSADSAVPTYNTKTNFNHNIGCQFGVEARIDIVCQTAQFGWAVGEVAQNAKSYYNSGSYAMALENSSVDTNLSASVMTGATSGSFIVINKTSGGPATITPANWKMRFSVKRGW